MSRKAEVDKVNSFLTEYTDSCDLNVTSLPCRHYLAQAEKGNNKTFSILDDEGEKIAHNFTTYEQFILWFVRACIHDAFKEGQSSVRRAIKEILGLTVR